MADRAKAGPARRTLSDLISGEWPVDPAELAGSLLKIPVSDLGTLSLPMSVIPALEIERITLDGFGPHDGPNTLELTDGLTLVTGRNGTGKTHLLLAVHWCLFGERGSLDPWMSEIDPMGRDLMNWNRLGKKDRQMKVEVVFTWNGERYIASRGLKAGKEDSSVKWHRGRKTVVMDGLPEYLSPDVLAYLLFQGEAVMFLASEDPFLSEGNLRSLVSKLSGSERAGKGLETISDARSALFEIARDRRKTATPLESELVAIISDLDGTETAIREARDRIEKLAREKKRAQVTYGKKVTELSKGGLLRKDEEEAASARARIPMMADSISRMLGAAGRELLKKMTEEALVESLKERSERTERRMRIGALEAQISIVSNILDTGKCMCGTEVGRTGMGRERIKSLLSRLEERKNELDHDLTEPIWTSDQVLEGARRCLAAQGISRKEYLDRIGALEEANLTVLREVKEVENRQDHLEELVSLVREMERSSTLLDRERQDLKGLIVRRKGLTSERRGTETRLAAAWGVDGGETGFKDRLEALDRIIEELETAIEERSDSMRREIENRSNAILSRLDPDSRLGHIRIHRSTYRIGRTFKEKGGERVLPMAYLSAGERELTALAVLSSIPGISGGMLVLDSPFTYIDSERRERIMEGLPEISRRVLISLPEGVMTQKELDRAKEAWSRKGLIFSHYELKMEMAGSMLVPAGGEGE